MTTAISIDTALWDLLRAVAFRRAQVGRSRPSVSALLEELVRKHRKELEAELK